MRDPDTALLEAQFRLALLQAALRRRLLTSPRGGVVLNRRDPALDPAAFNELDEMAELLWSDTENLG
jgi:hypothetical protein